MPAVSSSPLLRVGGLTKRYDHECAINDVTFPVFPGEILGVIGPNGAGKTTLMEAVVGLVAVDAGEVVWRGEPLPASSRRKALFYLPDGVRPYQDQVTADVISFFAGVYRCSAAKVDATLSSVGLKSVLHKRVGTLSKGYNRRLLLALGLLTPHELMLMDEPLDGFDLRQTRDIIGVLRRHAAQGRTFVLAIHQLADAERICDRFVLLSGGKVRGSGTLQELRDKASLRSASLEEIFLELT